MGQVREIQDDWSGGSKQDQGIEAVPANAAWQITNMLPGVGGFNLGLRGGLTYASSDMSTISSTVGPRTIETIGTMTSTGNVYVQGVNGSTGKRQVIRFAPNTSPTVTLLQDNPNSTQFQNPVEFDNKMFYTRSSSYPIYYTDSTSVYTSLSTTAPTARYAAAYKGRLVLANDGINKNRIWFSGIYDTTSSTAWSTGATGRWIDSTYDVSALASLQNMLLVFSPGAVERVRGTTPGGGGQAGDIVLEPLFSTVGVSVPWHMTVADEKAFFANASGVYMTDGANLTNLAEQGGMSTFWVNNPSTYMWLGYASGWLFITRTYVDSSLNHGYMINVNRRTWFRWKPGMEFEGCFTIPSPINDAYIGKLYTASASAVHPVSLMSMFNPTSTHDADGSAVAGELQSRAFTSSLRQKRFRRFFARYEATDPGSANPVINVQPNYDPIIEPGSSLTSGTTIVLPETTDADTARGAMNQKARAVAFHIATSGKGYPVGIQQIGVEAHELEPTRLQ